MLAFAVVLGFIQLMLAAHLATKQRGVKWNLSPRDAKLPDLTGAAGRLDRAFRNFMETFGFFLAAVLIITCAKLNNDISALGAQIYLGARVVYVPIYAMGTIGIRTVLWVISVVGIFMVLSAAFLN